MNCELDIILLSSVRVYRDTEEPFNVSLVRISDRRVQFVSAKNSLKQSGVQKFAHYNRRNSGAVMFPNVVAVFIAMRIIIAFSGYLHRNCLTFLLHMKNIRTSKNNNNLNSPASTGAYGPLEYVNNGCV